MNVTVTADALAEAPRGSIVWSATGVTPIACKLDDDDRPWRLADDTEGSTTYTSDNRLADYLAEHYPNAWLALPMYAEQAGRGAIEHLLAFADVYDKPAFRATLDTLTIAEAGRIRAATERASGMGYLIGRRLDDAKNGDPKPTPGPGPLAA